MARAKNEEERLDEAHFERVIKGLEQEKPITKKEACAILGIAYNTTRLSSLIEKYKDNKKRIAERRASLRGKPATKDEINFVIQEYLEGATIDSISNATYRSAQFVKNILEQFSVPIRASSQNYFTPPLIPEGAVRERFAIGEVVYSVRYDSLAKIETEAHSDKHGWFYRLWLLSDKWKQYAYQEATELASLQHLREAGVSI